jgi:hypothetical protein
MSEHQKGHNLHGESQPNREQKSPDPYWRRAHHDWRVWVAVFLMLFAMTIYVLSDNLALRPGAVLQQPMPAAVGS